MYLRVTGRSRAISKKERVKKDQTVSSSYSSSTSYEEIIKKTTGFLNIDFDRFEAIDGK
jgi:hypothetical protein